MINSAFKRYLLAILATLFFHVSLAYAIYEIESKKTIKEVFSNEIQLLSLEDVKKEKLFSQQEPKKEEESKEEPEEKKMQRQVYKKMEQKSFPKEIKKIASLEKNSIPSLASTTQMKSFVEKEESVKQSSMHPIKNMDQEEDELIKIYLSKIRAQIQSNIKYPHLARKLKLEGESIIEFVILNNGYIDEFSLSIKQSSGYDSLDKQAIKTLLALLPFEIPPKSNMTIILPVLFQLNQN